jgi:hypothetical protein
MTHRRGVGNQALPLQYLWTPKTLNYSLFIGTVTSDQPRGAAHPPSLLLCLPIKEKVEWEGKIFSRPCFGEKADTRLILSQVGHPRKPLRGFILPVQDSA